LAKSSPTLGGWPPVARAASMVSVFTGWYALVGRVMVMGMERGGVVCLPAADGEAGVGAAEGPREVSCGCCWDCG
jgi:hypothetical protein